MQLASLDTIPPLSQTTSHPEHPILIGGAQSDKYNSDHAHGDRQEPSTGRVSEGLKLLDQESGIVIRQKLDYGEIVGLVVKDTRIVYGWNPSEHKRGRPIFQVYENSTACSRWCFSGDCRPFDMVVNMVREDQQVGRQFMVLSKTCASAFLCNDRPEIQISLLEGGRREFIGKMIDPLNCTQMKTNILDKDGKLDYTINGGWCHCQGPCNSCQNSEFQVRSSSGEVVASMQKRMVGSGKQVTAEMDNFVMDFPRGCNAVDKALLMGAMLNLDHRHFDNTLQNENQYQNQNQS